MIISLKIPSFQESSSALKNSWLRACKNYHPLLLIFFHSFSRFIFIKHDENDNFSFIGPRWMKNEIYLKNKIWQSSKVAIYSCSIEELFWKISQKIHFHVKIFRESVQSSFITQTTSMPLPLKFRCIRRCFWQNQQIGGAL